AAPWVGEIISDVPFNPFPGLDTPAVGCAVAGVILILGLLRYRLLDVIPVARRLLVERMADGLIVLDEHDRILEANPAACRDLGLAPAQPGQPIGEASVVVHRFVSEAAGREDFLVETELPGAPGRRFELQASAIRNRDGKAAGRMIVLHDVTVRRQAETEREHLIGELQAALADIKTLRGLLPICMSCRKIRDDSGYWQNLEQYVEEHTEVQFSHGLCEDCLRRLYPEFATEPPAP
ncbi:MAG TPA: PAS domain S-box protein, partial [Spirochaetia bacterium]|nr:PAS domain S-box protein [Spirochaetia bacterium]